MTLHISAESALALALALNNPIYALATRRELAAEAIEDLIAFLDDTEADADLESHGDEQDMSWPESPIARVFDHSVSEDAELDDDDSCVTDNLHDASDGDGSDDFAATASIWGGGSEAA